MHIMLSKNTHSKNTLPINTQVSTPSVKRGFTLVELLVVIAIIGTLVALLLPAIGAARARATQATCANGIKQIGTGMINYETSKGRFPGYVQPLLRSNGQYLQINTIGGIADSRLFSEDLPKVAKEDSLISWLAIIAPQIEAQEFYDNMVDADVNAGDARTLIRPIEIIICPADTELSALADNAGASYVMNAGAWDSASDTDPLVAFNANEGDTKANGIAHNLSYGSVSTRLSGIKDGASNTLLLSENIHKETEGGVYCWAGVSSTQFAEQPFGMVWVVNETPLTGSGVDFQQPFSNGGDVSEYTTTAPDFARPASNHPGGSFNVIFADGHGGAIDPSIDYTVYQRLMTTNGRKCVDPVDHAALGFQTLAPLAPGDY